MISLPTISRIETAYKTIDPVFLNSPQFELDSLNELLGFRLINKLETLNPIRSFKGRGTDWLISQADKVQPLVCASAGNFGQGMAYCARKLGIPMTVFASEKANPLKLEKMRAFGAEVKLAGQDFDAAKAEARSYAAKIGARFVEDSKDIETAEGAGTIGLELLNFPVSFDAVLVPVGNGALINGIGAYFKAKSPTSKIIGLVAEKAPSMELSWQQKKIIETDTADTIADGIAVRIPVPEAVYAMAHTVDEMVELSEADIMAAMRLGHEQLGLVLEPSGAVGLAAAQKYKDRFQGQMLATIYCGSNLSAEQMKQYLA
ncbi:MAG: pyridoxal-phosphate dependent enzyme [Trueperaceae bacterium]|nr:pyridoxal-phosphate dependent enzyme [Trueperaceae bacterium]